jgi:hypothetical protein
MRVEGKGEGSDEKNGELEKVFTHTKKKERQQRSQIRNGGDSGRRWSRSGVGLAVQRTGSGGPGSFGADLLRRILDGMYSIPVECRVWPMLAGTMNSTRPMYWIPFDGRHNSYKPRSRLRHFTIREIDTSTLFS